MIQVKLSDDSDIYNDGGSGGMVGNLFQSVPSETEVLIQTVEPQILPMQIPEVLPPPLETNIGGAAAAGAGAFLKNTMSKKAKKNLALIAGGVLLLIITIYSFTKKKTNGKRKY